MVRLPQVAEIEIKVDTSALEDSKWYEYAIRFFFGGIISVVAGLLAKKYGPAIGGLFLGFPAIFPATATLAEKHEREKKERKGLHGEKRGRDAAALEGLGAALGSLGSACLCCDGLATAAQPFSVAGASCRRSGLVRDFLLFVAVAQVQAQDLRTQDSY